MPTEAEVHREGKALARGRLSGALASEKRTRHLPPSNPERKGACEELRDARAEAQEWEV